MSFSAALELYDRSGGGEPSRYPRANVILGHALLIGDIVGVIIGQAAHVLDAVVTRADPLFTLTEIRDLRVTLGAVECALEMAIAPNGGPTDEYPGRALAASEFVKTDENGALFMTTPQMPVTAVRREMGEIIRMLDDAIAPSAELRYVQT